MTYQHSKPDTTAISNFVRILRPHSIILVFFLLTMGITGCGESSGEADTQIIEPNPTSIPTLTPAPLKAPATLTPTALVVPTATWNVLGPGLVEIPILLYHHVELSPDATRYSIDTQEFEDQMETLSKLGYKTITHTQLREAIYEGLLLPPKPILITFDDGHVDNYVNAFPIMQTYGLTGTIYIVANRLGSDGFLSIEHLHDMIEADWEIGSHGMTHADLTTLQPEELRVEILDSRLLLEDRLGVEVRSFSYPFGSFTETIIGKIQNYGYRTGMGLGKSNSHTASTIYFLSRHEVHGRISKEDFNSLLSSNGIQ